MARLFTDTAKSWLAPVPHVTVEPRDTDGSRDILGQGHLDQTVAIVDPMKGIMRTTGDRVDLTKGREETPHSTFGHLSSAVAEVDETGSGLHTDHTKRHITVTDAVGNCSITVSCHLLGKANSTIPQELDGAQLLLIHCTKELREDGRGPNRTLNVGRKEGHQAIRTLNSGSHSFDQQKTKEKCKGRARPKKLRPARRGAKSDG